MKLLNIFKKRMKDSTKSSVQSLDKKQLEKVIGGTETTATTDRKAGSVILADHNG